MAIRDTSVCYYDSTQSGAPAISGTAGTLIAVLDACLVSGFGAVTASSLVVASGIATLTVSAGHGFVNPGGTVADVGIVATVSGVTGAMTALNDNWRVTVTSPTVLTWDCGEIADGTASGTVSIKHASAGWEKAFSDTNLAAYKSGSIEATGCYLRVDDTPAQFPTLIMYKDMSAISTGTGPAPLTGSLYFAKSSAADNTARAWSLYADDRMLYLFVNGDGATWPCQMTFGDIQSSRSPDPSACVLIAHDLQNLSLSLIFLAAQIDNSCLADSYTQQAGAVPAKRFSHKKTDYLGSAGMAIPNYVDNRLHLSPIEVWESNTWLRGLMPGLFCPVHVMTTIATDTIILSAGGVFKIQQTYSATYKGALDLIGPWRSL